MDPRSDYYSTGFTIKTSQVCHFTILALYNDSGQVVPMNVPLL